MPARMFGRCDVPLKAIHWSAGTVVLQLLQLRCCGAAVLQSPDHNLSRWPFAVLLKITSQPRVNSSYEGCGKRMDNPVE